LYSGEKLNPAPHHHFIEIKPCKSTICEGFFFSNTHSTPNLMVLDTLFIQKLRIVGPKSGPLSLQKKGNKNPPTSIKKLGG